MLVVNHENQKQLQITGTKNLSEIKIQEIARQRNVGNYEVQKFEDFKCSPVGHPNIPTGYTFLLNY